MSSLKFEVWSIRDKFHNCSDYSNEKKQSGDNTNTFMKSDILRINIYLNKIWIKNIENGN